MSQLIKILSIAITNSLICMSLILSPISYHGFNKVVAEDKEDKKDECERDPNKSYRDEVYKVGCDFQKDLALKGKENYYPEGVAGYVEQFIGAVFALIGITAIYKPFPKSLTDCPTHTAAAITLPIISAGSLSYLLGEVAANLEFKKASKISVDTSFQARKDESYDISIKDKEQRDKAKEEASQREKDNNKQIASYKALEKIYGHQEKGLNKKVAMATLAEGAFLTAEGIEITDLLQNISTAEALDKKLKTKDTLDLATLRTYNSAMGSVTAFIDPALCTGFTGLVETYINTVSAQNIKSLAQGNSEAVAKEAETLAQAAAVTSAFNPLTFLSIGATTSVTSIGSHNREVAQDTALSSANDTQSKSMKGLRAKQLASIVTAGQACVTSAIKSAPVDAGASVAAVKKQVISIVGMIEAIEIQRAIPLLCMGANTIVPPDLDSPTALVSQIKNKIDQLEPLADVGVGYYEEDLRKPRQMYYVRNILNNFYHRHFNHKLLNKEFETPQERVNAIAAASHYADFMTEEAMNKLGTMDIEEEARKMFPELKTNSFDPYKMLAKIKNKIIAKAEANIFMDLLMMGAIVGVLYYFLGTTIRNNAFPKPKNRIITFGIMALVNAAIIVFDNKARKEAKKRKEIVAEERRRFEESAGIKTSFSKGETEEKALNIVTSRDAKSGRDQGNRGVQACAVPNGKTFAPAQCPAKVSKNALKIPLEKAKFLSKGSLFSNNASLIGNVARDVASNGVTDSNSLSGGDFDKVKNNNALIRKKLPKLREKFDKLPTIKEKNSKKTPRISLGKNAARFQKLFGGGNASSRGLSASDVDAISSAKIPDIETLKKERQKKISSAKFEVSEFKVPKEKKAPSFDFDVDEMSEGIAIEDGAKDESKAEELADFDLGVEEINENENVSIFKLISNRYLISYPKLLDEK